MSLAPKKITSGRVYGGVEQETRAAERREIFINAGFEVFGTVGYRAGTVRVLCKAAGLTDRYFYESFKNSEELLCAVYEHVISKSMTKVQQAISKAPQDIEELSRAGLTAYFSCLRDPRIGRILQLEVLGVSPKVDALYLKNNRDFASLIVSLLPVPPSNRKSATNSLHVVGLALAGASSMAATHWMLDDYRLPQKSVVDACVSIYLGAFNQIKEATK
ncbi:TetR/AcrR family transcriptional regulator [Stenotrophobium rhamnosiphilum]|uniref:TetR/AcrR family transcriptional regulator n=1 Tax=Stenotrophobium rhamnosiphilum TaxID=2029166 RepID=A0A2T5MJW6_9GAMM|nr:TetR/AcrR family transcriptional regulator [Stenotrophobium rhamnosiphilum]PTU32839.1 TetR/AcrR family transcriptional regulator [Stenotrophobium rhamnosiphilum]